MAPQQRSDGRGQLPLLALLLAQHLRNHLGQRAAAAVAQVAPAAPAAAMLMASGLLRLGNIVCSKELRSPLTLSCHALPLLWQQPVGQAWEHRLGDGQQRGHEGQRRLLQHRGRCCRRGCAGCRRICCASSMLLQGLQRGTVSGRKGRVQQRKASGASREGIGIGCAEAITSCGRPHPAGHTAVLRQRGGTRPRRR